MFNFRRNKKGVITVFIALMLTGILSLGTLALEAGRFQAAKTQLAEANISAGNSMIASYDSTLYERYGLLAIDNDNVNVAKYRKYLDFNSDLTVGYKGNNISTFYTINSVEMEGLYNFTYPAVLKRQILSRAKYNIVPQDYSLNYYNMDYFLSDLQSKATYIADLLAPVANGTASAGSVNDIPADVKDSLKKLYAVFSSVKKYDEKYDVTLSSSTTSLLPSVTGTIEHNAPSEDVSLINDAVSDAQSILGANGTLLTYGGANSYNEIDVSLNVDYISDVILKLTTPENICSNAKSIVTDCRTMIQGINAAINILNSDKEGNLLLNSYIAGYFPNKNYMVGGYTGPTSGTSINGTMDNATFSGACVEYILEGNASEKANQSSAYDYIMAIRLVTNLYNTITNSDYFNSNNACLVASHIAWGYFETCVDAELLFKYNAVVPWGKYNMILPINNPQTVKNAFSSNDFINGMSSLGIIQDGEFAIKGLDKSNYRDSLALALWFVPNSKKMLRTADLIQLEMRYREQYVENNVATFLMSEQNTYCRVKCSAKLNSILPVISFSNSGMNGISFQSVKYVGY